jgi:hypothetical protein
VTEECRLWSDILPPPPATKFLYLVPEGDLPPLKGVLSLNPLLDYFVFRIIVCPCGNESEGEWLIWR